MGWWPTSNKRLALPTVAGMLVLAGVAAAGPKVVDTSSLTAKVVCGYQGWFRCPGDGSAPGDRWTHWGRNNLGPGNYTVEMWPDLEECDPDELFFVPNVDMISGDPAYLFSSVTRKTVERHFKWMRETGIDGVFLQRFINPVGGNSNHFESNNMVLANVRRAAGLHGRVFALEYDCSGASESNLYQYLVNDWAYLCDELNLLDDPRYLHHDGKPIVIIWGLGFNDDGRPFSATLANQIIDFFQSDPQYGGNYCIGGIPTGWRDLSRDSRTDPEWANVYRRWDAICPWAVGRFNSLSGLASHKSNYWIPDIAEADALGIEYLPVVWPGFSWDNLQDYPPGTSLIPRLDGEFIWKQIHAVQDAGADMTFVAMFDEVDEATAIFKVSNDHPTTDHWLTYGDLPHDWYMRLAGAAAEMHRGEAPLSDDFPILPQCNGDSGNIDLGEDLADRITHLQQPDGQTTIATIGGRTCRANERPGTDFYMYFDVADAFVSDGSEPTVCVAFDYFDAGTAALRLQYDSVQGPYTSTSAVALTNTQTWKRALFSLSNAYFAGRQNGGADFRVESNGPGNFYIDHIVVSTGTPAGAEIGVDHGSLAIIGSGVEHLPDAFAVFNHGSAPLDYVITTDSAWLSTDPTSGNSTGESEYIDVTCVAAGLPAGDYFGTITIADATGEAEPATIDVSMQVVASDDQHAIVDLGGHEGSGSTADTTIHLSRTTPEVADGDTEYAIRGGRACRQCVDPAGGDLYMYFRVDDDFAFEGNRPDVYITVDYLDVGTERLKLQCDTSEAAYEVSGQIDCANTGAWLQHTFHVTNAYFGNRQNNGSDFRFMRPSSARLVLDVVQVTYTPPQGPLIQTLPSSIDRTMEAGRMIQEEILVRNVGDGKLQYQLSTDVDWVLLEDQTGASIIDAVRHGLMIDTAGLPVGDHIGELLVTAPNTANSPSAVPILLRLLSPLGVRLDLDDDHDIDGDDFTLFAFCWTGPQNRGCLDADIDNDGDIDLRDFVQLQRCCRGAGATPLCE